MRLKNKCFIVWQIYCQEIRQDIFVTYVAAMRVSQPKYLIILTNVGLSLSWLCYNLGHVIIMAMKLSWQ